MGLLPDEVQNLDGPICANRLADSHESGDSQESFLRESRVLGKTKGGNSGEGNVESHGFIPWDPTSTFPFFTLNPHLT